MGSVMRGNTTYLPNEVSEKFTYLFRRGEQLHDGVVRARAQLQQKEFKEMDKLFNLAKDGDISILKHPKVSKWRGVYNNTPLHRLTIRGCVEVLNHKDAYKVKNIVGKTPADYLNEMKKEG